MAVLRRGNKNAKEKHKPEVVTGSFELHYEDVISRNRYALVAVFATGLVLLAVFIPSAVYRSLAGPDKATVEVESGLIINPQFVNRVENDVTASGDSYIEFIQAPEKQNQ